MHVVRDNSYIFMLLSCAFTPDKQQGNAIKLINLSPPSPGSSVTFSRPLRLPDFSMSHGFPKVIKLVSHYPPGLEI